jgi:hypothetical protein
MSHRGLESVVGLLGCVSTWLVGKGVPGVPNSSMMIVFKTAIQLIKFVRYQGIYVPTSLP